MIYQIKTTEKKIFETIEAKKIVFIQFNGKTTRQVNARTKKETIIDRALIDLIANFLKTDDLKKVEYLLKIFPWNARYKDESDLCKQFLNFFQGCLISQKEKSFEVKIESDSKKILEYYSRNSFAFNDNNISYQKIKSETIKAIKPFYEFLSIREIGDIYDKINWEQEISDIIENLEKILSAKNAKKAVTQCEIKLVSTQDNVTQFLVLDTYTAIEYIVEITKNSSKLYTFNAYVFSHGLPVKMNANNKNKYYLNALYDLCSKKYTY